MGGQRVTGLVGLVGVTIGDGEMSDRPAWSPSPQYLLLDRFFYYGLLECLYSIVLMVSRLINSLVHMCILLLFCQSAIGGAWKYQYLGLVVPPISGGGLLGLDGDVWWVL